MNWLRMKDHKGGYLAIAQCHGEKLTLRVYKVTNNTPWPWLVEADDKHVDAKGTCKEAKEAAVRLSMKWRDEVTRRHNLSAPNL